MFLVLDTTNLILFEEIKALLKAVEIPFMAKNNAKPHHQCDQMLEQKSYPTVSKSCPTVSKSCPTVSKSCQNNIHSNFDINWSSSNDPKSHQYV